MKKKVKFVFVLMISFCVINGLALNVSAETSLPVHNVDSGLDYATIQEAIDAHETLNGHIIRVDAGIYYEHVVVHKAVSLIGENRSNTIVDGNGAGTIIQVIANNVNITGFTAQNGGKTSGYSGISVENSVGVNISHNIIRNTFRGIFVKDSSNSIFSCNEISNNEYGIRLYYSGNNVFWGVKVSYNLHGFSLGYSDRNILSSNLISDNGDGIGMFISKDNVIFHNNFVNNNKSVVSDYLVNSWDNGVEGNYWSSYEGKDDDRDGIGDTPFIINENNTDSFPLMGMSSDFNVVYEQETYHVSVVCNSTVSGFRFDVAAMMLRFNVMGANDTRGFCRVVVPKVLVNWPYVVLVDGEQINSTVLSVSNYTHTFLYFTYMLSDHEVGIISKPYYQLLEKYNNIWTEYQELNSTYYELLDGYNELLASFNLLNAAYQGLLAQYHNLNLTYYDLLNNYTQLEDNYDTLNITYYEILGNYTELQGNYDSLNAIYNALNSAYNNLVADHDALNATFNDYKQTHSYSNSEYNTIVADRDYWMAEYDSLNATYHSLQANHTDLQVDYDILQAVFNLLNSTYNGLKSEQQATISELDYTRNLMYVFLATTVSAVILLSFSLRYYRMFHQQKKVIESYKNELKRLSPFQIARILLKGDAERLEKKIKRFEDKYGVKVQPSRTLEELLKSLKLKKKVGEEG